MILPIGCSTLRSPLEVEVTNRTLFPMQHLGHGALMGGSCLSGVLVRPKDTVGIGAEEHLAPKLKFLRSIYSKPFRSEMF